ncbi:MAG: hypothetical protein QXO75_09370, partial [Nitrososphaerota archaeon]
RGRLRINNILQTNFAGVLERDGPFLRRIHEGDKEENNDRLISLGYDFSKIFVDASNFYTLMEENDIAKKGHNKAHRYDLNQISYYIAATYDYIPLDGDSYPGNVYDSRTFPMIVERLPKKCYFGI